MGRIWLVSVALAMTVTSSDAFLVNPTTKASVLSHNMAGDANQPMDYKTLDRRLEILERSSAESLAGFYEPSLKSFAVRPGSERFSVTSTLFALESFRHDIFAQEAELDLNKKTSGSTDKIILRDVLDATLRSDWNDEDLFQVPLLIHVLLTMDPERILFRDMDDTTTEKVKSLIQALLSARPLRRSGQVQSLSDYLLFLCAQAMTTLHDSTDFMLEEQEEGGQDREPTGIGRLPQKALPEDASSELSLGLYRCVEVSYNELCRQLAYRSSGDRNNFDVMRLAYSLLTYVTTANTLSGSAGIQLVAGEGPVTGSVVGPPNAFLVREGLRSFFEEQNDDGLWDKGQPIYKSFRRTGRNVGNAFVFATDTVGSLLK